MARIRTVKPELWTDPDFVELSLSARLLFIASWNFATDHGVLPDKPRQLQMQCLPADGVNVGELIEELVRRQFMVRRYAPNGDRVLVIRTFNKNQKINRPTPGRWGNPAEWPEPDPPGHGSRSAHGDLREHSPLDSSDNSDTPDDSDTDGLDSSDPYFKSVKQNITTGVPLGAVISFPRLDDEVAS